MSEWMEVIFSFLVFSSGQLFVLGVIAATLAGLSKVRGYAALWIFGMVLLLPCLSTLSYVIPSTSKVGISLPAVPAAAPVFQTWTETGGGYIDPGSPASVTSRSMVPFRLTRPVPLSIPWYRLVDWKYVLTGLWFTGVVILLLRIGLGIWKYRKLIQLARPVTDPDNLRVFQECMDIVKPGRIPRFAVVNYPCIPMITGFFQPWIILPAHYLQPEKRNALRFTLLHELAHLRRKDTWWLLLENAIGTVYFFHPAVYWVRRRIDREREYLCDRFVVQLTNQKASYADFLLNEVWESRKRYEHLCAIPLISRTSSVARRVREIIKERKTTMFSKIRDACLVSIILVACVSLVALTYTPQAQSSPTEPARQQERPSGYGGRLSSAGQANGSTTVQAVKGTVVDSESGEALAGARIFTVKNEDSWDLPGKTLPSVQSGENGQLTLNPPEKGVYQLAALKEGYGPTLFTLEVPAEDSVKIVLEKTDTFVTAKTTFAGQPWPEKTGFYIFQNGISYPLPAVAVPDQTGVYALTGVQSGAMRISARSQNETGYLRCYPSPLEAKADETTEINLELLQMANYLVTLNPNDGKEVGLFEMKALELPFADPGSLCSNRSGNTFRMEIPDGHFTIQLKAPGYEQVEFDPARMVSDSSQTGMYKGQINLALKADGSSPGQGIGGMTVGRIVNDEVPPGMLGLENINAENIGRIGDTGLYHVMPNFESIEQVHINKKSQMGDGYAITPTNWSYDNATNQLTVTVPIDDEKEIVVVFGKRKIPWSWRTSKPLAKNSVKVIIENHLAERGVEYQVDEEQGLILFLKEELCIPSLNYYIAYGFKAEPGQPSNVSYGGAIGNHRDQKTVRRLMGIPEDPEVRAAIDQSVGTNATPTDDPLVYSLSQIMDEKTMRVGVASNDEAGDVNWLVKGTDFTYDPDTSKITLLKAIEIDEDTHYLFVMAVPRNDVFMFSDLEPADTIEFIVEGITLKKDRDFTVDYSTGKIQLTNPNLIQRDTQYHVSAGGTAYGNYSPHPVNLSPDPAVQAASGKSVGLGGTPTDDPMVYNLAQFVDESSIGVAVANKNKPGDLLWLTKGIDFSYDVQKSKINLLKKIEIAPETHYIYVQAVPERDRFIFHDLKPDDPIEIIVKGNTLVKDKDYTVDYSTGIIKILDPNLINRRAKFSVKAGEVSFGNY